MKFGKLFDLPKVVKQFKRVLRMNNEENQNQENQNIDDVATDSVEETLIAQEDQLTAEDKLRIELNEQKDKYLRLYSEFDNFRRRTAKEKIELNQSAGKEILTDMLSVLDDFERAQKTFPTHDEFAIVVEGVNLVYSRLYKIIELKGVKPLNSSIGTAFDSDFHEAITQIPAPSADLKGKVIDEIQKGYILNDKVIRFAKVVVGA